MPPVINATIGTDPSIPFVERNAYLQEHAQLYLARQNAAAHLLVERLLVEGLEHAIQIEDIEALSALEKTPAGRSAIFMRKVMIELMLSLRRG